MNAYILCGGFGTRLRSVIDDTQKAVVDIHGRPFLALVLAQLREAGIRRGVLCAHYRADQLAALLPSLEAESGLSLQLVIEETPQGTGGAVLNALFHVPPEGRYLVLNADTFLDSDAYRLALDAEHEMLVGVQVEDRSRYGSLRCSAQGEVLGFEEKGKSGPGLVNAGVYGFSAGALEGLPIINCSMEQDLLPSLIRQHRLYVRQYTGFFLDIGTPDSLDAFKSDLRGSAI
ncbi:sugar phosphate nucleotidyltransferase [Pseudomonas sp. GWSMS-1]|uniref:sugar phosphate nucleotidyltransferase n=1 Tax=Pseudomonas sp. GWSMS-1 TaxID=3308997 RepID=UPI003CEEBEE7